MHAIETCDYNKINRRIKVGEKSDTFYREREQVVANEHSTRLWYKNSVLYGVNLLILEQQNISYRFIEYKFTIFFYFSPILSNHQMAIYGYGSF